MDDSGSDASSAFLRHLCRAPAAVTSSPPRRSPSTVNFSRAKCQRERGYVWGGIPIEGTGTLNNIARVNIPSLFFLVAPSDFV